MGYAGRIQVSSNNVFKHRTLSARLRPNDSDLWQIYRVLDLVRGNVNRCLRRGIGVQQLTPTVVKTSCNLLTSVIKPGSFTLILCMSRLARSIMGALNVRLARSHD
jgi:hypothetical protein